MYKSVKSVRTVFYASPSPGDAISQVVKKARSYWFEYVSHLPTKLIWIIFVVRIYDIFRNFLTKYKKKIMITIKKNFLSIIKILR